MMPRRKSAATAGSTVRAHCSEIGSGLSNGMKRAKRRLSSRSQREGATADRHCRVRSHRERKWEVPSVLLGGFLPQLGFLVDYPLPSLGEEELDCGKVVFAEAVRGLVRIAFFVGPLNGHTVEGAHLIVD